MKIDVFSHIFTEKYMEAFSKVVPYPEVNLLKTNDPYLAIRDMDYRAEMISEYGVVQVLTTGLHPLDIIPNPRDAVEVAKIANDEMAEIIARHPREYVAGVATLPLTDMDAALKETDRAIKDLGFKGVQISTNIKGKPIDAPEFMPLYEKMAGYDLPIWIHPRRSSDPPHYATERHTKWSIDSMWGYPFETTAAMTCLVFSGVLEKYPDLKIITHHCGAMVPFFEQRIVLWYDVQRMRGIKGRGEDLPKPLLEYFRKFYNDTAICGSTPALMCGYAFFGADRLLFGTDHPYDAELGHRGLRETIRSVEEMDIPDFDKKKIFEDNAKKLLHLTI